MINNASLLLILSAALSTPLNDVSAPKKSSCLYTLKLKPDDRLSICRLKPTDRLMDLSEAGVKASKYHAMCRDKYVRCIQNYGSRKVGPSTTQCGAWRDICNAQGVWPGPTFLYKDEDKK